LRFGGVTCALLALFQGDPQMYNGTMLRVLKPLGLIWLCLALVAGSVTMAVARSQSAAFDGSRTIVICTGYGVTTITLDADGNPTGPVHPCPDCLAGLAACIVPGLTLLPAPVGGTSAVVLPRQTRPAPLSPLLLPPARGPPVPV
jgi:hypothetical protein